MAKFQILLNTSSTVQVNTLLHISLHQLQDDASGDGVAAESQDELGASSGVSVTPVMEQACASRSYPFQDNGFDP